MNPDIDGGSAAATAAVCEGTENSATWGVATGSDSFATPSQGRHLSDGGPFASAPRIASLSSAARGHGLTPHGAPALAASTAGGLVGPKNDAGREISENCGFYQATVIASWFLTAKRYHLTI